MKRNVSVKVPIGSGHGTRSITQLEQAINELKNHGLPLNATIQIDTYFRIPKEIGAEWQEEIVKERS